MKTALQLTAPIAALAIFASGAAMADEKPRARNLPGVETDYRIVKPAPEPDDRSDAEVQQDRKRFKVGNWDVEVSGYVWYQVGASSGR